MTAENELKDTQENNSEEDNSGGTSGLMDSVVNLCKRRGFIFPSAEIYGGFRSTYDYGPLGVLMLQNVKNLWWRSMVQSRDDIVGLDCAILSSPRIWEASGHLKTFTDPLVDCKSCHERFRADQIGSVCPNCGSLELTAARDFNLMFKTHAGPVESDSTVAYMRPETAQGMFVNFLNVLNTSRKKLPFGIAQIGKSFRNEITPGNFVFRTREFEQMEMEYFVEPETAGHYFDYWVDRRYNWYLDFGIPEDMLRIRPHVKEELSHYSTQTSDIEFKFPWGFGELEGIANRTDYDLKAHSEFSGIDLRYFDPFKNERYFPYVIEPAAGATRTMMAFLLSAYSVEELEQDSRILLKLHPRLAPIKVAVLPLSKKQPLVDLAKTVTKELTECYMVDYDESQSIGKRYRRQDEIGTPLCVTIDFDSLDDNMVTIRDRDTLEQQRVKIDGILDEIKIRLGF